MWNYRQRFTKGQRLLMFPPSRHRHRHGLFTLIRCENIEAGLLSNDSDNNWKRVNQTGEVEERSRLCVGRELMVSQIDELRYTFLFTSFVADKNEEIMEFPGHSSHGSHGC